MLMLVPSCRRVQRTSKPFAKKETGQVMIPKFGKPVRYRINPLQCANKTCPSPQTYRESSRPPTAQTRMDGYLTQLYPLPLHVLVCHAVHCTCSLLPYSRRENLSLCRTYLYLSAQRATLAVQMIVRGFIATRRAKAMRHARDGQAQTVIARAARQRALYRRQKELDARAREQANAAAMALMRVSQLGDGLMTWNFSSTVIHRASRYRSQLSSCCRSADSWDGSKSAIHS